jgi:hypothetical protein
MNQPWKQIERRGVCHYPDVSNENIYIVSVENYEHSYWHEEAKLHQGRICYVVVFDELSRYTFQSMSSPPFATLNEAVQFAEEKIPTGIVWNENETK